MQFFPRPFLPKSCCKYLFLSSCVAVFPLPPWTLPSLLFMDCLSWVLKLFMIYWHIPFPLICSQDVSSCLQSALGTKLLCLLLFKIRTFLISFLPSMLSPHIGNNLKLNSFCFSKIPLSITVYKEADNNRLFCTQNSSPKIQFPYTIYTAAYQEWSKSLSGSSSCYRNINSK